MNILKLQIILFLGILVGCHPMFKQPTGKAITIRQTDALLGPDWSYKMVMTLPAGTELAFFRMDRDWYEVQLTDGSYAWVYKNNVRIIPFGNLVITQTDNMRDGPYESARILRKVVAGTRVTKLEIQGWWVRIALQDGSIGWIQANSVGGL